VKIVVVGCGRVGASAAETWDAAGHEVIILDVLTRAFERLPSTFGGTAIRGDGTDEDVLRRAGAEGADVFVAMTEGDNRNVMAAQLAAEALEIPNVIAKINDPVRAAAYSQLGIATICRTGLMVDAMNTQLGLPPSGLAGMLEPSGTHPGGEHHASRSDGSGESADTGHDHDHDHSPAMGSSMHPSIAYEPTAPGAVKEA
jgi:trk system potassium uptake protein TrkA